MLISVYIVTTTQTNEEFDPLEHVSSSSEPSRHIQGNHNQAHLLSSCALHHCIFFAYNIAIIAGQTRHIAKNKFV